MSSREIVPMPDAKYLRIMQYIVFGSLILYFGRDIFIPVSFALLISFVLYPVCVWMERKGVGRTLATLIAMFALMVLVLLVVALLVYQFARFVNEWPVLQEKFNSAVQDLSIFLINVAGITLEQQKEWINGMSSQSGAGVLLFLRNAISASAVSAVMIILIPVYAVLILIYRRHWVRIVHHIFPGEDSNTLNSVISKTVTTYYNFIKGMAIVYVLVGILNSIGLLILGIPHAILFGFIASVLTFVPYVGIMVGSLLPIAIAWITFDSVWYPVGIIGVFAFVQYLEANVIFPVAVSNRLNVNTLVMLIAIFAGGVLWGMAGMILFVPFVGIAKLVADHNPKWKTLSMILGTNSV